MSAYSKKLIFAAGCMGMLIFGIVITLIGSVLPSVIVKFNIELADAGSLFIMMSMGMMIGSLIFGPLVDRYGYKGLLVANAALVFAGIEGIAFAPSSYMLMVSLFIVGFAGGAVNGGTNALISDISTENRGSGLSLLGVFFGIGALSVPFILGTLLDRFSYENLIGFVGALILLPLLFFTLLKFPSPKHGQGFPVKEGLKLFKEPALLLFGLILFIQSGMEMTVSGWSATFMIKELSIQDSHSVLFLSFYWFGLIVARLIISEILRRTSMTRVMRVSLSVSVAGSLLLVFSTGPWLALPALFITGIGFAAIFPLVFAYVGNLFPKYSGTAFSIILTIALFGGMSLPYIAGLLAGAFNLRASLAIVPVCMIITLTIFRKAHKMGMSHTLPIQKHPKTKKNI
ncbi:MAG: MFS transporter [Bacteroidales bacterium]